jgi:hypothetical protein
MKITSKLLEQKTNDEEAIHDQNYKKLGCKIQNVKPETKDYKELVEYFNNTKGSFGKVSIGDIYEVVRPDEQKNYDEKIGNNMLLWHGSRLSNFVGILSQGLRIAPPEAPVSGYLFGKGIYLADMSEKSIHYCRSHGSDAALILLIEVILCLISGRNWNSEHLIAILIQRQRVDGTEQEAFNKVPRVKGSSRIVVCKSEWGHAAKRKTSSDWFRIVHGP